MSRAGGWRPGLLACNPGSAPNPLCDIGHITYPACATTHHQTENLGWGSWLCSDAVDALRATEWKTLCKCKAQMADALLQSQNVQLLKWFTLSHNPYTPYRKHDKLRKTCSYQKNNDEERGKCDILCHMILNKCTT